jgi:hypothetical protein
VVRLLRIKNRLGKCRTKKLEFVEAMLVVDASLAAKASAIDSLLLPSPSGGGSKAAGEGGSTLLAELIPEWSGVSLLVFGGSGFCSSRPLIHSRCMPVPRWAPTPARRSSSFFLIRHTMRGHLGSLGRSDLPLKNWTARSRSDCEERLTKAH